ncbi:NaeI family type II restriction endonuclease [Kitasatospora sp. NPDC057500]|uniref:NaeI family type II restriction endonuclease n=1 Tax=Kitasatospora sp. NPDC057500 TaxID=3346151 RepID=UPI00367BD448
MTSEAVPLPLFPEPQGVGKDRELEKVRAELVRMDPAGRRFATVLRETIDQLLDGERTGRYDWKDLFKTEKTHAGTLVEINLQREFEFSDGSAMDYKIAGIEVDCKYSQQFGSWMIPPEAVGHLCLLVWANDYRSRWSAGLVRIRPEILNGGTNRDLKLTIQAAQRDRIVWLWHNADLPENVLLHLDPEIRSKILVPGRMKGQMRINQLFRLVRGRRIGRGVVRTAAQQVDYMARVREGGPNRARPKLREEGIIILGDYPVHQAIAAALGGQVPEEGEFVAHRVVRAGPAHAGRQSAEIGGSLWVVAEEGEWEHRREPAPRLPDPQTGRA